METFIDDQLKAHIERSPFSETFTAAPASGGEPFEIRGIFDESVVTEDGRKTARPVPRITVCEAPEYEPGKTEIIIRGKTYRMNRHETDANLGAVIYLI
jgi:hypothetical protein